MKTLRTVAEVRQHLAPIRRQAAIGLAPTMGALHEGHVALFRAARARAAMSLPRFSSTRASSTIPRTLRPIRARNRGTWRSPRPQESMRSSSPPSTRSIPPAMQPPSSHKAQRWSSRAPSARALQQRRYCMSQTLQHRRTECRVLRPERRAASRRHPADRPGLASRSANRRRGNGP